MFGLQRFGVVYFQGIIKNIVSALVLLLFRGSTLMLGGTVPLSRIPWFRVPC